MLKLIASILAGAASVLAFAPFGYWPIVVPSLGCLFLLLYDSPSGKSSFLLGYFYGLGLFGAGVYWIYFSLHLFGAAIAPLAAVGTFLFVAAMALYPALFAKLTDLLPKSSPFAWFVLGAPALWLLVEWFRCWFLTGFPWLSIGYSTIHTPLAGYAPVGGVYLNSLILAIVCGLAAYALAVRSLRAVVLSVTITVVIGVGGNALKTIKWTEPAGDPVSVTMVQGNISQELKFLPNLIKDSLNTYAENSNTGSDLIIWPESAIPTFFSDVVLWEQQFVEEMAARGSTVLSGGFHANADYTEYYNAIKVLGGSEEQIYTKRHLVPFGEFIPFRSLISILAEMIEIPMSDLSAGRGLVKPITVNGVHYGMSICYEDAFGSEMIPQFPDANVLINISNDAWFGDSTAPHQHQEIAAMRSLEFQRPMLRVTNTGITSLISYKGAISSSTPQFKTHILQAEVQPRTGSTPFVKVGNWIAVVAALFLVCLFGVCRHSQRVAS